MPCKISDHSDQFGLGPHPPPWGMGWRCFQAFLKAASHASLPLCMMWKNMIKYLLLVCTRLYSHSVSLLVSRLVGQSVHPKSMKSSQISKKRLFLRWKHGTNDVAYTALFYIEQRYWIYKMSLRFSNLCLPYYRVTSALLQFITLHFWLKKNPQIIR